MRLYRVGAESKPKNAPLTKENLDAGAQIGGEVKTEGENRLPMITGSH